MYAAFLSDNDRHNSSGDPLKSVADILRQDRANYHKGRSDRKDEDDGGIFATEQGRAKFSDYGIVLENLKDSDIVEGRGNCMAERFLTAPEIESGAMQASSTAILRSRRSVASRSARLSPSCTKVSLHRMDSRRNRRGSLHNLTAADPKKSAQQNSTISPSARSKCRRKNLVSLRCLSSCCNKATRKSPESSAWTRCIFATPSSISTA